MISRRGMPALALAALAYSSVAAMTRWGHIAVGA